MGNVSKDISNYHKIFGNSNTLYLVELISKINRDMEKQMNVGIPYLDKALTISAENGRRLRGVLLLLSAELFGGYPNHATSLAVAIELLHRAAVVHDDIIDHDKFRRGKITIHEHYGEETAIALGDLLISLAFETLREVKLPVQRSLECYWTFSKLFNETCKGELKDILWEKMDLRDVSFDSAIEMEYQKTAAFGEAAMRLGAFVSNADQVHVAYAMDYGRVTGLAFQLHNDLRDMIGTHQWSKQSAATDLKGRKKTPILVKAFEMASNDTKHKIQNALNGDLESDTSINQLIMLIKETGAIEFTQAKIYEYLETARQSLNVFPDSRAKQILLVLGSEEYLNLH